MSDEYATRSELAALRREVHALKACVAQFIRHRVDSDPRFAALLPLIFAFSHDKPWMAAELIEDARRADPDLWCAIDSIVGDRGSAPIKLGRWLARHIDAEAGGLRLESAGRQDEVRLYRVTALR